ncbi:gasdermin-B [Eumetopias jubatus]|uniref:gasdermin-B n=1 Tax=Eumetopias jubatus TaxID=34886 RepID=UPI001016D99A|nr:gasdermin-B [Eumetopias jubatus]
MRADLYLVTEILETARKETLKSERLCMLWSRVNARASEEQHLVAEALEKGTLPLLKDQVDLSWSRTGVSSPMIWAGTLTHDFSVPSILLSPSCCSWVRS